MPMNGVVPVNPKKQFLSATGAPLINGTLSVYLAGTTTPTNTWQDKDLTVLNSNPVILDNRGECLLWLDPTLTYKFLLKNALGADQWTVDNILGAGEAPVIAQTAVDTFSGDGSTTAFNLSVTPSGENATSVYISGVYVSKLVYSVAANVLTFAVAPAAGTNNIQVNTIELLDYTAIADSLQQYVDDAEAAAVAAAASAVTAAAQVGLATTQAGIATTQAGIATTQAGTATTQAGIATTQAGNAAASAVLAASTLTATSTTSNSVGLGSKSFTVQTNKQFQALQDIKVVDATNSANYMYGTVTSYNAGTGALVINSTSFNGSGTLTSWNISVSGPAGQNAGVIPTLGAGNTAAVIESLASANDYTVCALTSSLAVACYQRASNSHIRVAAMSISAGVVTAGTPVDVNAQAGLNVVSICALTATTALVSWYDSVDNAAYMVVVSVSGTTVTVGTRVQVTLGATNDIELAQISSNFALLTYGIGTAWTVRTISVSGTTPTANAAATFTAPASSVSGFTIAMPTATLFFIGCIYDSTNRVYAGTISGTTVTQVSGNISIGAGSGMSVAIQTGSTTKLLISASYSYGVLAGILDISTGTSWANGWCLPNMQPVSGSGDLMRLVPLQSGRVLALPRFSDGTNSTTNGTVLYSTDDAVFVGGGRLLARATGNVIAAVQLDTTYLLAVYRDPLNSGFPTARTFAIGSA